MSNTAFQSSKGGAPFPRTANEWVEKGMSQEQADHRMRQDVFGHDYQTDARGNPIERGKGSASQPTAQHQMALSIAQDAEISRKMRMGWHPGLEQAFDPRSAPAARRPAKRRQARRKSAAAPAEGNA